MGHNKVKTSPPNLATGSPAAMAARGEAEPPMAYYTYHPWLGVQVLYIRQSTGQTGHIHTRITPLFLFLEIKSMHTYSSYECGRQKM